MITNKPINVSDERLAEMHQAKKENEQILKEIQVEREALRQDKGSFASWKDEQMQLLNTQKIKVDRESSNLESNREAFEARVKQWEQDHV